MTDIYRLRLSVTFTALSRKQYFGGDRYEVEDYSSDHAPKSRRITTSCPR
jgi:hypothetical protein